ncbi:uncharacterized protein GGS22DRAFT_157575 [Annulohypoxylon maeteangense]|uniref:uncharacterized protein n=1 Tax=Annulohypoxylon maeteangense TaxID=1927788 RepID=UPI002008716F|nr:uncharacterized protein GGS22DRAFT_157575 [Annulohypoxylon maeteangense]KAI0887604.1 hypothetical protein GGS22DRAFT_157575 [Annulohypoxylon maeteangense]
MTSSNSSAINIGLIEDFLRDFGIPSVPDISGVGVLIGFIAPAFFLLFVVCIHYILAFDPTLDPFRRKDNQEKKANRPNPFDQIILRTIRGFFKIRAVELRESYIYQAFHTSFNQCVLSLADTQAITGLSILIGNYLSRSGRSAFHWKMVTYLAWFSCATHLSALIFLRNYLINHPTERWWRLAAMLTLLVCLVTSMLPTGHFDWEYLTCSDIDVAGDYYELIIGSNTLALPSDNATSYFNLNFDYTSSSGRDSMIISILLLGLGFIARIFKLHRRISWFGVESISVRIINRLLKSALFFQRFFGTSTLEDRVVSNIVVSAHVTLCVWVDLWASLASDVFWLIFSLAWGTIKIKNLRVLSTRSTNQDNSWSFGQVLPVLLLALPLITLFELFLKSLSSEKDKAKHTTYNNPTRQFNMELNDLLIGPESRTSGSESDSEWIIRPELLDTYYEESIWMPSIVHICNTYVISMAVSLLVPAFVIFYEYRDDGLIIPSDTATTAQSLIVWFIFVQGATIQLAILLSSLTEMKLNNQKIICCTITFITLFLQAVSCYICYLTWNAGIYDEFYVYLWQFLYVLVTFGLFLISLIVRQLSILKRARGKRSHRSQAEAVVQI